VRVAAWVAAVVLSAAGAGLCALPAFGGHAARGAGVLGADGIGNVRFGLPKAQAVRALSGLLGAPSARGVNAGCGPRFTEVEWNDLIAEFRLGRFSGYRYVKGGWPLATPGGSPLHALPGSSTRIQHLATAKGISIGSTLARARSAYGSLRRVGAEEWATPNGLTLADNANIGKVPPTQIYEIKTGTCGAF
jgi:hypothetical protein